MVADPEVVEENVTEHEPLVDSVQLVVVPKLPRLVVQDTVPVGVLAVPGEVSVTVAVQLLCWFVVIEDGVQLTVVEDARRVIVILVLPLLPL
jgi:hypothetical protein